MFYNFSSSRFFLEQIFKTFTRIIVEQNSVSYKFLQPSHNRSRTYLEQFQSSSRALFYKILELF